MNEKPECLSPLEVALNERDAALEKLEGARQHLDPLRVRLAIALDEVATLNLQNERCQKALEQIASGMPRYPDGDAMGEEMCAKIALGRNCPQCGCTPLPCPTHKEQPIEKREEGS